MLLLIASATATTTPAAATPAAASRSALIALGIPRRVVHQSGAPDATDLPRRAGQASAHRVCSRQSEQH